MIEAITGHADERVAAYRGVSDPLLLRTASLFVAEGRAVVGRLLESRRFVIRSLLLSDSARRQLEPLLAALPEHVPVYVCRPDAFLEITGHDLHRGCLALVEYPPPVPFDDLAASARLVVALEGVSNADNVGGVFRNAAAFGVDAVVLGPTCCSPLYRKAVRTSMGAVLRVPFVHATSWPEPLDRLRAAGFALAALVARPVRGEWEAIHAFSARAGSLSRLALLVGAEGTGLAPATEEMADHRVHIPIGDEVDSLNLAVATGIALEQLTRSAPGRGILAGRTDPQA